MATATTTIQMRIDTKTKKEAGAALEALGLDLASGIRLFLRQVSTDKAMPFTPVTKEARLRAMFDADVADALEHGTRYTSVRDAMPELYV